MLPVTCFSTLECGLYCVSAIILICISIPYLVAIMPVLLFFFLRLRRAYLCSSREIKRIEAVTRSPIYSGAWTQSQTRSTVRRNI